MYSRPSRETGARGNLLIRAPMHSGPPDVNQVVWGASARCRSAAGGCRPHVPRRSVRATSPQVRDLPHCCSGSRCLPCS